MSIDRPFYEKLCQHEHKAARWWLAGDRIYYIGLYPAIVAAGHSIIGFYSWLRGEGWNWFAIDGVVFSIGIVIFYIGGILKSHAYTLAERDGIVPFESNCDQSLPQTDGTGASASSNRGHEMSRE